MRLSTAVAWVGSLAVGLVAGLLFVGCENSSATSPLTISPESAVLDVGQSQEFVVTGGYQYDWSLDNDGIGSLNTRVGDRVVYTCLATNAVQTLHVRSTIIGTSTGGTSNGSPYQVEAQAIITFPGATVTSAGSSVSVTADAYNITSGQSTALHAIGGSGSYTWSVLTASLGAIAGSGASVTYNSTTNTTGQQSITVTSGGTATAYIQQSP